MVLSILKNRSYFQFNALTPGIGFRCLRVYWHCPFSCAIQAEAVTMITAIFYHWSSIIGITYWKQLCPICAHNLESLHQPRGVWVLARYFLIITINIWRTKKGDDFRVSWWMLLYVAFRQKEPEIGTIPYHTFEQFGTTHWKHDVVESMSQRRRVPVQWDYNVHNHD